ncbi:ATP-binding cassette domain-containing protein [Bacillus sp. 31A1R]|uniref:ATP-binding cassette domain-containing protein n=1 Tax=Robertmurraya mangrovi TaxID=3098077 RepID=A0ABU5ITE6_9BACI|nr:ATP-binding cassette domain-containing protein [Bacillus sp. 31A1R]MDZ5470396.1 ATP-binding cassette domain-containing protein [Bacillus sp. 31A1R]
MSKIVFEAVNAEKVVEGFPILKNINLQIRAGEVIAIVGANGSGKNSLLNLIGAIYDQTSGVVNRYAKKIGYVPMNLPDSIEFKVEEYLSLVGRMSGRAIKTLVKDIHHYADIFKITPDLVSTLSSCSKCTKHKVCIIQVLLNNPKILLLDEPFSFIEKEFQFELFHQLLSIKGDKTIVFTVSEELVFDKHVDKIINVKNGEIVSIQETQLNH